MVLEVFEGFGVRVCSVDVWGVDCIVGSRKISEEVGYYMLGFGVGVGG